MSLQILKRKTSVNALEHDLASAVGSLHLNDRTQDATDTGMFENHCTQKQAACWGSITDIPLASCSVFLLTLLARRRAFQPVSSPTERSRPDSVTAKIPTMQRALLILRMLRNVLK